MMNTKLKIFFAVSAFFVAGCGDKNQNNGADFTLSPETGTTYKSGDEIKLNVHYPSSHTIDSIVYFLDSARIGMKKDSAIVRLKTDSMVLGIKAITARIFESGKTEELTTNILLLAAKAPEQYSYKVEKVFPHDTASYTEGLQYKDGFLYESTGEYKYSTLQKVTLSTGKAVQIAKLDDKYFGEGISIVGNKVVQLTYKEKVGLVYDLKSFKLLSTFVNNVGAEGWGMCFDGKKLYMDDGTNRIWFLDKDDYHQIGYIDVCDDKTQINQLNELEYIDGKLYANVYQTDNILVIDPKTGAVLQKINMKDLYPMSTRPTNRDWDNNVLNGIAWDEAGKRLFVTGKKWPHLYQVKFTKL